MLSEITIENVAVIEKATAVFSQGFNVLTGETGAGKSILIDSINAILGNRTSRDIVRNGAAKACIWASFSAVSLSVLQNLEAAGYPSDGEELLLYREVTADGKSSCRINGMPATAALLREVCGGLINIHGQHDNQSLLDPARHLATLDLFAQNGTLLQEYRTEYQKLVAVQKEMDSLTMNEADKARRLDLLRYEVDEIDKAQVVAGEEEKLLERRTVVRNAQSILDALNTAYAELTGDDEIAGGVSLLGDAAGRIAEAAVFSEDLTPLSESINEAYYAAQEAASDIQNRLASFEFDEQTLNAIEARLDVLYRLKQKYGVDEAAILAYGEKARAELAGIEFSEERMGQLTRQQAELSLQVSKFADALTQGRFDAFEKLQCQIADALAFLNMPGIVMTLKHARVPFGPNGQDDIEFYISTNPGEQPKPLAKIASGGELARIMLAMKSALAGRDDVSTVIYDEIDTGISGSAAGRIGQMLRDTAKGRQVICVTHTAQVAAYAKRHLLIQKEVEDGRTYTRIWELEHAGRVHELARIISGDQVTEIALANAEEMLRISETSA